jgi:cell division protein FtsL
MNKQSGLIIALIAALLLLAAGVFYFLQQKKQMDALVESFELEKDMLEDDYNELSLQYEGYKFSVDNDSLVSLLVTEQEKVQRLQEELRTVKSTNAKRVTELKKELETLRTIMRGYVVQIDSLNRENERLRQEKQAVTTQYEAVSVQAATLRKEKERLSERVTLAERLVVTGLNVKPVNKRGKVAKHIRQTQQIVVSFSISKNITAATGERVLYARLTKPNDEILIKSRANTFRFEGKDIPYSMKRLIEYDGEETPVILYWDVEEFLLQGTYRVDIFSDGDHIGGSTFVLND